MMILALIQSVALVGGTVHSLVPGETPIAATVILESDRIRAIGADLPIPEKAQRIDVSGMHLVPGLIDGMVNHDADHDRLYVSAGVTLVRDVGNDLTHIIAERDSLARDRGPGPALWCAGAVLDGPRTSTTSAIRLASPEEASEKLGRLFEDYRLDYLSISPGLSQATFRKVVEIGHARGLRVWGSLLSGSNLSEVVDAGQDGLFDLGAFLPANKRWSEVELEDLRARIDKAAGSKMAITPMLGVYAQRLIAPKEHPPELAYLSPIYFRGWVADLEGRKQMFGKNGDLLKAGLHAVDVQSRLVRALHEKGVALVPGSASPNAWLFPGRALLNEMKLWVRAGIPAPEVLRMATTGAAQVLGAHRDRGTLEAGKIADIVITKDDPEASLENLSEPAFVVLRGRVLDRATLNALTDDLSKTQKRLQYATMSAAPLKIADPELPIGEVLLRGTVETRVLDMRLSGESWAVVKRSDGSLTYLGHMLTLGTATTADTDVEISQTIQNDVLTEFLMSVKSGPRLITVKGTLVGGSLNIERHLDGGFVDNHPVKDRIALVDAGSVTAELILGRHVKDGAIFKVLFFEDFEPAFGPWELHVDPKDGTSLVHTHNGEMTIRYEDNGAASLILRQPGAVIYGTRSLTIESRAAGGLGLPESKRYKAALPANSGKDAAPAAPEKKPAPLEKKPEKTKDR